MHQAPHFFGLHAMHCRPIVTDTYSTNSCVSKNKHKWNKLSCTSEKDGLFLAGDSVDNIGLSDYSPFMMAAGTRLFVPSLDFSHRSYEFYGDKRKRRQK